MSVGNIELRKLAHVAALADEGSYVAAARRLNLTQSALTRSIQALEASIGLRLFDRDRSGAMLTPDGMLFLDQARGLLRDARSLGAFAEDLAGGQVGALRIGFGPSAAAVLAANLLVQVLAKRPQLEVSVLVQSAPQLLKALLAEQIDLFICHRRLIDADAPVQVHPVAALQSALVVRPGHPLLDQRPITKSDLVRFPLLVGALDSEQARAFRLHGSTTVLCDDVAALRKVILASDAIWLTTVEGTIADRASCALVSLACDVDLGPPVELGLFRLQGRTPSAASRFVEQSLRGAAVTLATPEGAATISENYSAQQVRRS